jgi:hypothetical protein
MKCHFYMIIQCAILHVYNYCIYYLRLSFWFSLFFFAVLEFELMDLNLIGICSITWAMPPAPFYTFSPGCPQTSYLCFPITEITDIHHPAQLICWCWGLTNFLLGLSSNHDPLALHCWSSLAGIIGMSYHAWLHSHFSKTLSFKNLSLLPRGEMTTIKEIF